MDKLLKMYKGSDGQFWVMRLKIKNGDLLQPRQLLCPLELSDEKFPKLQLQSRYGLIE